MFSNFAFSGFLRKNDRLAAFSKFEAFLSSDAVDTDVVTGPDVVIILALWLYSFLEGGLNVLC